jgi:hypothetical protein
LALTVFVVIVVDGPVHELQLDDDRPDEEDEDEDSDEIEAEQSPLV